MAHIHRPAAVNVSTNIDNIYKMLPHLPSQLELVSIKLNEN